MNVKELIKELQKFDGNTEVYIKGILELHKTNHIHKIKVRKDKQVFNNIESFHPLKINTHKFDRYNQESIYSKHTPAILITDWVHPKTKTGKR